MVKGEKLKVKSGKFEVKGVRDALRYLLYTLHFTLFTNILTRLEQKGVIMITIIRRALFGWNLKPAIAHKTELLGRPRGRPPKMLYTLVNDINVKHLVLAVLALALCLPLVALTMGEAYAAENRFTDDVKVKKSTLSVISGDVTISDGTTNMYTNPGMEQGSITGWSFDNKTDGEAIAYSTDKLSGTYCARIKNSTVGNIAFWQDQSLTSGVTYTMSCYAKDIDCPTTPYFSRAGVTVTTVSGGGSFTGISTTEWKRFTWTFTANATGTLNPYIRTNSNASQGYFLLDDLQFEQASAVTAFVDGTRSAGDVVIDGNLTVNGTFTPSTLGAHSLTGTLTFDGVDLDITTGTNEHLALMPNGTGNVGIGTTGPGAQLHLYDGSSANELRMEGTGADGAFISFKGAGHTNPTAYIRMHSTGAGKGELSFSTNRDNGATPDEAMRIDDTGNVGIGTTGPATKLHVNGGNLRVQNTNYVDILGDSQGGYVDSSTYLQLRVNGDTSLTNAMKLEADGDVLIQNGNVGIGTTNPARKLHVYGGSDIVHLRVNTTDADAALSLSTGTSKDWTIGMDDSDSAKLKIQNTETIGTSTHMTLQTDGNVGIGTQSPLAKLHTNGDSWFTGHMDIGSAKTSGSLDTALSVVKPGTGHIFEYTDNNNDNWVVSQSTDRIISMGPETTGTTLQIRTATPVITILPDAGNVGIGTTSPAARLDISEGATKDALLLRAGTAGAPGTDTGNQIVFGYNGTATYQHAIRTRHHSGQDATNAIDFYVWDYGTDALGTIGTKHVMSLDAGNVGIGTTAPAYKLDVAGDINYTGALRRSGVDQGFQNNCTRVSNNQYGNLSGTTRVGWSSNAGVTWSLYRNINTGTVWASRDAEEQEILTAMGRSGVQHFQPSPIKVLKLEWDTTSWITYPNQIRAVGYYTFASYAKLLTGTAPGGSTWMSGITTSWKLCGTHGGPYSPGTYLHLHPTGYGAGSALIIWPAAVSGYFPLDSSNPMWGYWDNLPNDAGYITDGNTNWDNSYGYITAGSTLTGLVQSTAAGNSYFTGGNVGIGTTGPNYNLHVTGASQSGIIVADATSGYGSLALASAGTIKAQLGYAGSASNYGAQTAAGDISLKVDNTNLHFVTGSGNANTSMIIQSGGNVGIGITNPNGALWVQNGRSYFTSPTAGETAINASASAMVLGPQSPRNSVNNYSSGIAFDHLLNYSYTGNVTYHTGAGPMAWIGLRHYDFPGYERSNLVFGLRSGTNAGDPTIERMCIEPINGNVGIGTTNPDQKLVVTGWIKNTGSGIIHPDGSVTWPSALWGDQVGFFQPASTELALSIGAAEKVRFDSNGNVGIGTAAPGGKLHIQDTQNAGTVSGYIKNAGTTGNTAAAWAVKNNADSQLLLQIYGTSYSTTSSHFSDGTHLYTGSPGGMSIEARNDNANSDIRFYTGASINQRMIIDNAGNVGIGTTGPGELLDISSTSTAKFPLLIQGDIDNAGGYTGIKFGYDGSTSAYLKAAIMVRGTTAYIQPEMHFLLDNTQDASNADINDARLSILPSGSVGIGDTTPGYKLDVNGTGRFTGALELNDVTRTVHGSVETFENVAHYYNGNTSTGIILITITSCPNIMLDAEINVQGYNGLGKYHVRGYTYTGTANWHAPAAGYTGSGNKHPVRFAGDASNNRYILIGTTTTSWGNYIHATVQRVSVGYGSGIGNWSISLITSEAGLTNIVTPAINSGPTTFSGAMTVTGYLTKSGGGFMIDHPLDPENKVLTHSFVESPDMKNLYDGVVVLDENGESTIELPDYFEALNRDFRYSVTPIGSPAMLFIKEEIRDNRFVVAGGEAGMKVSWQVTGTRKDAWAEKNRPKIEEDKGSRDGLVKKGEYIATDCFEQ